MHSFAGWFQWTATYGRMHLYIATDRQSHIDKQNIHNLFAPLSTQNAFLHAVLNTKRKGHFRRRTHSLLHRRELQFKSNTWNHHQRPARRLMPFQIRMHIPFQTNNMLHIPASNSLAYFKCERTTIRRCMSDNCWRARMTCVIQNAPLTHSFTLIVSQFVNVPDLVTRQNKAVEQHQNRTMCVSLYFPCARHFVCVFERSSSSLMAVVLKPNGLWFRRPLKCVRLNTESYDWWQIMQGGYYRFHKFCHFIKRSSSTYFC